MWRNKIVKRRSAGILACGPQASLPVVIRNARKMRANRRQDVGSFQRLTSFVCAIDCRVIFPLKA